MNHIETSFIVLCYFFILIDQVSEVTILAERNLEIFAHIARIVPNCNYFREVAANASDCKSIDNKKSEGNTY